ncbi:MAG: anthranilate synthase component I family protein [Phycisphaerae bacterium]
MRTCPLQLDLWDALERWPRELPLAAVVAGDGMAGWSMLGVASRFTQDPAEALASPLPPSHQPASTPRTGGWIGALSYEHGWTVATGAAGHHFGARPLRTPRRSALPAACFARVDAALLLDHSTGAWSELGDLALAQRLVAPVARPFARGDFRSLTGKTAYLDAVGRTLEYIRAGDIYQANIAHELRASFEGDPLGWFIARGRVARPRHGAFLAAPDFTLASLSPELFLEHDPATRLLATRPMKGTRAGASARASLDASAKDRAELAMIVDLLRNDLGRTCEPGSVRVDDPRAIEEHGSGEAAILQATARISGRRRQDRTLLEAVNACFPCGSVTGAPKARAMQVIEELETTPRGFYCGSMGFIGDDGAMRLNVAIRTATFTQGIISYSVGAGIVADSNPDTEWDETLVKARAAG